jgi:hypothetical protein
VNGDVSIPPSSEIVTGLLKDDPPDETKEVLALVGYVGPGRNGDVRLYSDIDVQRWMDIPQADIVGHCPLDAISSGKLGRTVVWVRQDSMFEPVFNAQSVLQALQSNFAGSWISTWPLIPGTRMVAAEFLDLLPRLTQGENRQGG